MIKNKYQTYKFGLITASAFVVANMIGTGVFTSLGFQLQSTSNFVTILLIWLLGGIIALCGALVYGELGAAMPRSGGEYHYLRVIYHPMLGFMAGWASLIVGFAAPVALASMAFGTYLNGVFPDVNPVYAALGILTFITLVHVSDLKLSGMVQSLFTFFKIAVILLFIIAGLFCPAARQDVPGLSAEFDITELFTGGFAVSLIWVYYAYSGWNASAYMAGEIRNPQRNIPRSLLASTVIVTILYVLLNGVFMLTTPADVINGQLEVGLIASRYIFPGNIWKIMGLVIALLLVSSISSMAFLGPRVSQVMGEDTYILRFLSKRSSRGIPYVAVWVQFGISFLLIITDSFALITKYAGVTLSFFALLTVTGLFVHRRRFPHADRPYKTWGYPVVPCLFILLISWSIVYLVYEDYENTFINDTQGFMWLTLMSGLTLLTGAGIYLLNRFISSYKLNRT